jgi:cytochrome c oxidase assembly factor CtaG
VTLLLALVSPLDALGDDYLFSAHMLQHELLVVVVPPLLLLGLPKDCGAFAAQVLAFRPLARLEYILSRPWLAWILGMGTLWIWHLPLLYNAALADERIHVLEHLSFLVTAVIFWWPVFAPLSYQPLSHRRMGLLPRLLYLLLAVVACDTLGTLLAYTPPGLYPAYLHPLDKYGILPLLRERWGITPALDQQAGGLLMGLLSDPVYLAPALIALARYWRARSAT